MVDSIMLPAHAQLTTGSLPDDEPAPDVTYFKLDIDFLTTENSPQKTEGPELIANVVNAILPEAHATAIGIGGMSVIVSGTNATVRFLNTHSDSIFKVVAPIDESPSGEPVEEAGGCHDTTSGPKSVQLIGYTYDDQNVQVKVTGAKGGSWQVLVPKAAIGNLSVEC